MEATTYKQPRRLNSFTVTLLLMAIAGGYWFWVYFPAYWDAWTVDHLLQEGVSNLYAANNLGEPQRTVEMKKCLQKIQSESIRLAHVTDPDFDVSLDLEETNVVVKATYTVVIHHPYGGYVSKLNMKRVAKANIKKVSWDD